MRKVATLVLALLPLALLALGGPGCVLGSSDEENATNQGPVGTEQLGEECDEAAGAYCEEGICAYGKCRNWCRLAAPGSCGQTQSCIDSVCRLMEEQQCGTKNPCPTPLVCGADSWCRPPCETASDCVVDQTQCLGGACVNPGESRVDQAWFSCSPSGERSCDGNLLVGCNTVRPGLFEEAICSNEAACQAALEAGSDSCE